MYRFIVLECIKLDGKFPATQTNEFGNYLVYFSIDSINLSVFRSVFRASRLVCRDEIINGRFGSP